MPRERFPEPWRPSVIVCEEKHVTRYIAAVTRAQAYEQALLILAARMKSGRCYESLEHYPEPAPPSLTPEQASELPEGPVRKAALVEQREYRAKKREREDIQEETFLRESFIARKDGDGALDYLIARGGEYERVRLEVMTEFTAEDAEQGVPPW